jgi:hypothetical protein
LIEPPLIASLVNDLSSEDPSVMETCLKQMEATRYVTQSFQDAHYKFHEVALNRYPNSVKELVEGIYLRIKRHQRISFSRPHVVHDYTDIDHMFLVAIRTEKPTLARQILQFHLIDACLGMMFEQGSSQIPGALMMAAQGTDIVLEIGQEPLARPIKISWRGPGQSEMPPIETINLQHAPDKISSELP